MIVKSSDGKFLRFMAEGYGEQVFTETKELFPDLPVEVWTGDIGPGDNKKTLKLSLAELEQWAAKTAARYSAGELCDEDRETYELFAA